MSARWTPASFRPAGTAWRRCALPVLCAAALIGVAAPEAARSNGGAETALWLAQNQPATPAVPAAPALKIEPAPPAPAAPAPGAEPVPPGPVPAPVSPSPKTAPAKPKPPAAKAPPPPKNLEKLAPAAATGILGKKVWGPDGADLGLVVDVLVDDYGYPRAAIIDFGGFLGVGSRRIAVDWRLLRFVPGDKDHQVLLDLGRTAIQAAPVFKPDAPSEMVGPPPPAPAPPHGKK